jgi:uncharacterized protein
MNATALPLFPLGTVLFPAGPLSLRIFEPRYLDMVRRCLREQTCFGVVLILDGAESGPVSAMAEIGTEARVVDFDTLPDGLLGIVCVGERRFRVLRHWRQSDGLNLASVEYLPCGPQCSLPEEFAPLGKFLRKLLPELGTGYAHVEAHYEDAGWVADRLSEVLPLAPAERLALLGLADPLVRLRQVAVWSAREPAA